MNTKTTRREISTVLRKAGFSAIKRVGTYGHTAGYNSWALGSALYVTYQASMGGTADVASKNAEILAALVAAGIDADYCANYPDGRIEIF
jgi:hypothetical protein